MGTTWSQARTSPLSAFCPGGSDRSGRRPGANTDRAKCAVGEPASMTEHHEVEEPEVQPAIPSGERTTAPQSDYTLGDVGTGVAVLVVGLVLTVGLALAL